MHQHFLQQGHDISTLLRQLSPKDTSLGGYRWHAACLSLSLSIFLRSKLAWVTCFQFQPTNVCLYCSDLWRFMLTLGLHVKQRRQVRVDAASLTTSTTGPVQINSQWTLNLSYTFCDKAASSLDGKSMAHYATQHQTACQALP